MFGNRRYGDRAPPFDAGVIQYPMFASATGVPGFDAYGSARGGVGRFPGKYASVSFDTSSREPHLLRSRVFVGNINTQNASTREDLIDMYSAYGPLLAVTVFKGYAFLQFSSAAEADNAVAGTNKMDWGGCMLGDNFCALNCHYQFLTTISTLSFRILDVKLAISGMKNVAAPAEVVFKNGAAQRGVKRSNESATSAANVAVVKRDRPDAKLDDNAVAVQNAANQQTATGDHSDIAAGLFAHGMADTLICGGCRWVTSDLAAFCEHRRESCNQLKSPSSKPADEPDTLQCFTCSDSVSSSWGLIQHLVSRHGLALYKK